VIPTELVRLLADSTPSLPTNASPTLTILTAVLGGGFLLACVAVYKAKAEKGTVVASGAENAVLAMGRSLEAMEKRAMTAERREAEGLRRESTLENQLETIRASAESLLTLVENTLASHRTDRSHDTDGK
jgi:threonine dehydratase